MIRYYDSPSLIVVPTTSLVEQLFKDFQSYGFDSEKYCHRIYSGREKSTDKKIVITTWQSIYKLKPNFFWRFKVVIGDEAHGFKAKSLTDIMTKLTNCPIRVGTTGTLDGTKTHKYVLEGLFGPVYEVITTKKLMEDKYLANLNIKCIVLQYPESVCKAIKSFSYPQELEYIVMNEKRNNFIRDLVERLDGNTLVLYQLVEKHGEILYEEMKEFIVPFSKALKGLQKTTLYMAQKGLSNPYEIGAAATDYLKQFGLVAMAYMWLLMLKVAFSKKDKDDYYQNKIILARFFYERILPETLSRAIAIGSGSKTIMSLPDDGFDSISKFTGEA